MWMMSIRRSTSIESLHIDWNRHTSKKKKKLTNEGKFFFLFNTKSFERRWYCKDELSIVRWLFHAFESVVQIQLKNVHMISSNSMFCLTNNELFVSILRNVFHMNRFLWKTNSHNNQRSRNDWLTCGDSVGDDDRSGVWRTMVDLFEIVDDWPEIIRRINRNKSKTICRVSNMLMLDSSCHRCLCTRLFSLLKAFLSSMYGKWETQRNEKASK